VIRRLASKTKPFAPKVPTTSTKASALKVKARTPMAAVVAVDATAIAVVTAVIAQRARTKLRPPLSLHQNLV
jgi:hypothetical protein